MGKIFLTDSDLLRLIRTQRIDDDVDNISKVVEVPKGPTSAEFSITVGIGLLVDIPADEESRFDRLYIEFTSSDISTGYTANPLKVIADGVIVSNLHTGLIVKKEGGVRKWQIFNASGTAVQVRGFLTRQIDAEIRSPIAYGFDSTNPNNYRALSFTGQNELIVALSGANQNNSSPVALNTATNNTQNELLGNAAVVNATVVGGVAAKTFMVTAVGLASNGITIGGELIQAQFTFSGAPNPIARLAIKTGVIESDHVVFGDSGPVGNVNSPIRVTIVKPFAIGDGWVAWATVRYI